LKVLSIKNYTKPGIIFFRQVVSFKSGSEKQTLYCRHDGGEYCYMRAGKDAEIPYSKNPRVLEKISGEGNFENPLLDPGKVIYSGYLKGYSKRLGISSGLIRITNRLNNQKESYAFKIEDDGSFAVEFPLAFPQEVYVGLPYTGTRLFFEPGKTLFHLANTGIDEYPSLFMGVSAAVNYGLKATENIAVSNKDLVKEIEDMTDIEYIEHVINTRKSEEQKLEQIIKERNIGNKTLQLRSFDILFREAANAVSFNQNRRRAVFYSRMESGITEPPQFEFAPFDINLLKRIKDTPVNSDIALVSPEYINLINVLKLNDFSSPQGSYYHILTELANELNSKEIEITGEEKDMIEYIRLNLCENYNDENARNFNKAYRVVLNNFRQKHWSDLINISNEFYVNNLTKNLNALLGKPAGLPVEITILQNYLSGLKNETGSPDEEEFKKLKQVISTDYLKEYAIAEFYKKRAENEIKNYPETPSLKTEGDKIFDSIIRKYRGKVIYVDFWATWCGPCIAGIEKIKPLKDELADEDVVFLYITDPSSPETEYKKRIPDIKGEHVRLSNDEWIHLKAKFNIYGIPQYALVDKDGKIVNAHLMPLEIDELKKQIIEQVNK
jgi:thiol-disulfide isomerase/thioredoxin